MPSQLPISSRTNLTKSQIAALQRALDVKGHGVIIDVPAGNAYDADLEILASVGEELTKRFTGNFLKGGWPVHFLLLESDISNAYAYWLNSFEVICITNSLAREIDALCGDVASYLVDNSGEGSGFSYIRDVDLLPEVKRASLKGLLIQGVMAFFVGHEAGHLFAGHKPVMIAAAAVAGSDTDREEELEFFVEDFIAEATSKDPSSGVHSLRLNAHEVDADVQGLALTAKFWLNLHEVTQSGFKWPYEAGMVGAASSRRDRLLLLASTGAALGMSLLGFKRFADDWNRQTTHPLTAVRCVVGLAVLANQMAEKSQAPLTMELQHECFEALSLVHSRLGSILLMTAQSEGKYSQVARVLKGTPSNKRLDVMFNATGIAQAVAMSNDVVKFLAELSAEFNACASQRAKAIRVPREMLVEWTAVALSP